MLQFGVGKSQIDQFPLWLCAQVHGVVLMHEPMGPGNLKHAPKHIPHSILVCVHTAAEGVK